jgi:para-aminobenzoate synthetase component 1
MTISNFIEIMNTWGHNKVPFLFAVDFEMEKPWIISLKEIDPAEIRYDIHGFTNAPGTSFLRSPVLPMQKWPLPLTMYEAKFDIVFKSLGYGDSYLTNLTMKTAIDPGVSMQEIFFQSKAAYKLLYKDQFLVFSPETFVQVRDGKIFSYPMKGTIDATIPGAAEKILKDQKELAEHVTIVDLIRNDLSQVASHVHVSRFRYLEELRTNHKNLLQVSSEITGDLPDDHASRLGELLVKLLPAGSVSGAPKTKTLEIIRDAEQGS